MIEQAGLPFAQHGTVHSRHASYTGAVVARLGGGVQPPALPCVEDREFHNHPRNQ